MSVSEGVTSTLRAQAHQHEPTACYAIDSLSSDSMKSSNPNSGFHREEISKTLQAAGTDPSCNQGGNVVISLQANGIDRADNAWCNGCGWRIGAGYTLNTIDRHAVCFANRPFCAGDTYGDISLTLTQECAKRPGVTVCYDTTQITSPQDASNPHPGSPCHSIAAAAHVPLAVCYSQGGFGQHIDNKPLIRASSGDLGGAAKGS